MMRVLRIGAFGLLALLVLLAGVVWWVIATESGTRFAAERSRAWLPEGMSFSAVEGRLVDRVIVRDVAVDTGDAHVTIERIAITWSPWALRRRQLTVHELYVSGVTADVYAAEDAAEPLQPEDPIRLPVRLDLPLSVTLESLVVEQAVIQLHGEDSEGLPMTTGFTLDSLALAASYDDATLDLANLSLRSPLLDLDAALVLAAHDAYALDAGLAWTLRLPELPAMAGETMLSGSLAQLELNQSLTAPFDAQAELVIGGLLAAADTDADDAQGRALGDAGSLTLDGTLRATEVDPAAFAADLPVETVDVDVELAGSLTDLELLANIDIRSADYGDAQVALDAVWSGTTLALRELHLTQPGRPGILMATGELRLAETQDIVAQLDVAWEALQWPLEGDAMAESPRGELRFGGTLGDYTFDAEADVVVPEQPPLAVSLVGTGSLEQALAQLTMRAGDGRLEGELDLRWQPDVVGRLVLEGTDLDPALFAPDWPGRIELALLAEARIDDDGLFASIERLALEGVLQGQPLRVAARADYTQPAVDQNDAFVFRLDLAEFEADVAGVRLSVSGRVDDAADLSWQINATELAALAEGARGSIIGEGSVTGPVTAPRITAELRAEESGYEDYRIDTLVLDADIDLSGGLSSVLTLNARGGQLNDIVVNELTLDVDGTPEAHDIRLSLQSSEGDVELVVSGDLSGLGGDDVQWRFRVLEGHLAYPQLAPWALAEPVDGFASAAAFGIEHHCWISDPARLCLRAAQDAAALEADLELTDLPFDYFAAFLPPDPVITGSMNVTGAMRLAADGPLTGDLHLTTSEGELIVPVTDYDPAFDGAVAREDDLDGPLWNRLRFEPGEIRVTLMPDSANLNALLPVEYGHLRLTTDLTAADGADVLATWQHGDLAGGLEIDIPDLAFLGAFITDLRDVAGSLRGELVFGGTTANPVLSGRIEMQDGRAMVPLAGITVSELSATVAGHRDGVQLSVSAQSGGGTVTVSGDVNLLTDEPLANLRINGDAFLLVNTPDARLFVSPDLSIDATPQRVDVTGDVRVPRADITPVTPPSTAVGVSADEVLLTGDDDEVDAPLVQQAFHARIRIMLGNEVYFDGYGLTARLQGSVQASQSPGTPLTGTGEINLIGGEYRAYGQGLVIETGNIYFAGGPITEPALDIRAVRRPRAGITVGANVVGTLEEPVFSLFSEPPMSELETLSYLVLGRSLQEAPAGESSALSQAALAMGLRGGDFLARNIGERLGVDQFGIETGTGEAGAESDPMQAALVVGKYLSPRLYVSYGIGLFDPINVLRIQYTISDRWRIITQSSSEATGADLVFAVERGR